MLVARASLPGEEGAQHRARATELEWEVSRLDWSRAESDGGRAAVAPVGHAAARELLRVPWRTGLGLGRTGRRGVRPRRHRQGNPVAPRGSATEVAALADRLTRDLHAHAFAGTNPALEAAVGRAVAGSVAALDQRLFADVDLADGPVVVIPGRTLMAAPWGMLPSLSGRPVTVAPSVTRWSGPLLSGETTAGRATPRDHPHRAEASSRRGRGGSRGQGLGGVGALATAHEAATAESVREALAVDGVVHVAAHGTHQRQSPWFSSLLMADGPVFAHELPRQSTAQHVVLSACDVGRLDPRPGDEPLGLTAALMALGVRSVVAPVAPVSDAAAADAMVAYHRHLAAAAPRPRPWLRR